MTQKIASLLVSLCVMWATAVRYLYNPYIGYDLIFIAGLITTIVSVVVINQLQLNYSRGV